MNDAFAGNNRCIRRKAIKLLLDQGILIQNEGGGRSTNYRVAEA